MKPDICIYHAPCADGFTAAWAVWRAFPDCRFHPGVYGEAPPDVTGLNVVLVDFSYKRPVLEEMSKSAKSITVLDHHKTAQADLETFAIFNPVSIDDIDLIVEATQPGLGNIRAVFDMNRSGAQIAWDFFHPLIGSRPALVDYVADRDLWNFRLPESRAIAAWVFSYPYSFPTWDELAWQVGNESYFRGAADQGNAIERKHGKDITELLKATRRTMVIGGVSVPVANLPYTMASDAAGEMAKEAPFAACYFDRNDGQRIFSLRSRGAAGADVSAIAASYGGGGHKNAAGFQVPIGWEGDT